MDEAEILAHLLSRDERGLQAAQERYGARLKGLAQRIAGAETAEECVNDALLATWNAIPPLRPRSLYAYLCRLTRNAALNRFASQSAQKRGGTEAALSLDELAECLPGGDSPALALEAGALSEAISHFLRMQPTRARDIFLARYFYALSVREIAVRFSIPENTVKTSLHRTRLKLRSYLEQEDYL